MPFKSFIFANPKNIFEKRKKKRLFVMERDES